jgi:site-specific recombinase XerD
MAYIEEILQQSGIHITTVNKHVSRLWSLFEWAVNHQYTSKNIFAGLRLPRLK